MKIKSSGMPMKEYRMQTSFPDAVIGNMCPYPVRMCVVIVSTNFPVFKVIYVTAKCSIMGKELPGL